MKGLLPPAATGSQSSVNSMMSPGVTSAGASDRDMRNRSARAGCRIEDPLVRQNAARRRQIVEDGPGYFHGMMDT